MNDRKKYYQESPVSKKSIWLITYADLCTLLLTFFVLIFSMAVIDVEREKKVLNSLTGAFKFIPSRRSVVGDEKPESALTPAIPMDRPLSISESHLKQLAKSGIFGSETEVVREEDRTMIRLVDKLLFEEGSSKLSPEGEKFLSNIGLRLKSDTQDIEIRGHVDRHEILKKSDWETFAWKLSTERALTVYRLFINLGIQPGRMSAHGMSFHHPLVDESQFPSFRYKNRRVEILLGKNPSVPTSIYSLKAEKKTLFQYRHFFFPLFEKETEK